MHIVQLCNVISLAEIHFLDQISGKDNSDNQSLYDIYNEIRNYYENKGIKVSESEWPCRSNETCFYTGSIRVCCLFANDINPHNYNKNSISRLSFYLDVNNFDNSYNQLLEMLSLFKYNNVFGLYIYLNKSYQIASREKIRFLFECDKEFSVDKYENYVWLTRNIRFDAYISNNTKSLVVIRVNDRDVNSESIELLVEKLLEIGVIIHS